MRKNLVLCCTVVLTCTSIVMGNSPRDSVQQTPERPVRVQVQARGFLGAELGEVNRDTVQRLKLREERGALIEEVIPGSGASSAGLQKNDVVVKWDSEPIESAREMTRHIRETPVGRTVRLGVIRDGREIELNVKIGERAALLTPPLVTRPIVPRPMATRPLATRPMVTPPMVARPLASRPVIRATRPDVQIIQPFRDRSRLGVDLNGMTDQLAEYFGLSKRTGALVVFVFADSPAAKAGLKAGDVILSAGGNIVETPGDLHRVLTTRQEGAMEVKVLRDKQEKTFTVQLEKGTRSWLLQPDDFDERDVRFAMAPMKISIPKITMAPMSIVTPRVAIAPLPKFTVVPTTIVSPKITLAPMALPNPTIKLAPMKMQIPKINISPVKIIVVPRRVLL